MTQVVPSAFGAPSFGSLNFHLRPNIWPHHFELKRSSIEHSERWRTGSVQGWSDKNEFNKNYFAFRLTASERKDAFRFASIPTVSSEKSNHHPRDPADALPLCSRLTEILARNRASKLNRSELQLNEQSSRDNEICTEMHVALGQTPLSPWSMTSFMDARSDCSNMQMTCKFQFRFEWTFY